MQALGQQEDPSRVIAAVEALVSGSDPGTFVGVSLRVSFVDLLIRAGSLDRAAALARQSRPSVAKWFGHAGEIQLLRMLADAEQRRGAVAEFLEAVAELERLGRQAAGDDWASPAETALARGFLEVEEYDRAAALLSAKSRRLQYQTLRQPILIGEAVDDRDMLLEARLLIGRGHADEGMDVVRLLRDRALGAFEKHGATDTKFVERSRAVLDDVARVEAAAGHAGDALKALTPLEKSLDPAEDLDTWTEMSIRAGELRLATGEDQKATIERFEWMAPRLPEFPELPIVDAVRMDLFLGRYYRLSGNLDLAGERLARGLRVASTIGALDEQIAIQREVGQVAAARHDVAKAIDAYRNSIALLEAESENIDSHASKIGYRTERAAAIPLLVAALSELVSGVDVSRVGDLFAAVEAGKSRALTELLFRRAPGRKRATNVTLAAVQSRLPPSARVLEYYAFSGSVIRIDVTRSAASVTRLEVTSDRMDESVGVLRDAAASGEPATAKVFEESAALAKALLPADIFEGTAKDRTIYVIPTGRLHLLPFSMLVGADGKYLDDRTDLQIVYLPNAALLLRSRHHLTPKSRSIAYVNPAFDREQNDYLSADPALRSSFEAAVQQWRETTVHWEEPLTPSQFIADGARVDNVLLYAHASFLPADPMSSYVKLSGREREGELTAADLLALPAIGGGLWTLAACSTGQGKLRSGDEVLGLPRALMASGASMVVVTLWDVDVASLEAMTIFYGRLAAGDPVATALHATRTRLRAAGRPPFDWAPFIMMGFDDFDH